MATPSNRERIGPAFRLARQNIRTAGLEAFRAAKKRREKPENAYSGGDLKR